MEYATFQTCTLFAGTVMAWLKTCSKESYHTPTSIVPHRAVATSSHVYSLQKEIQELQSIVTRQARHVEFQERRYKKLRQKADAMELELESLNETLQYIKENEDVLSNGVVTIDKRKLDIACMLPVVIYILFHLKSKRDDY